MKKKLFLNTLTSLLLQVVTVVCGFVLPRLILQQFGSEVNGLINSISQFLGVITLLDAGVGQVVQSALYKPLANGYQEEISRILASGNRFFHKILVVLLVYVVALAAGYPALVANNFDWIYTASLIFVISIGSFAQYGFGLVDSLLLNADQKGYISHTIQIIAVLGNTVICAFLIQLGASIHLIKLASTALFLIRPVAIHIYINRQYQITRNISYQGEPIKQKWNGFAQHISAFVMDGTDTLVLSFSSSLANVSVYGVYSLVANGIHQLHRSATAGIHALIGELWARQDMPRLRRVYGCIEMGLHFTTVFLFSCTGILIVPFVQVYTAGITDANYIQPAFAILFVLAHGLQCIRTIYNMLILGAGHYKQTQRCHITAAILNLGISIIAVQVFGLIGVALGRSVAIGYQVIWMAAYDSKHLLKWPLRNFVRQALVDVVTVLIIILSTMWIKLPALDYISWMLMALQVAGIAFLITIGACMLFYWNRVRDICRWLRVRK